ncbi:hypothetical protein HU200_057908 [Digitaria exilis]|uniref:Peptidyl-prolyl cis-trans isomerase n=1 Tax=Digitaria exilis TaxID=1010633 RepID=A0A835AEE5_9POAL|nr:hypothetical protein HU200_057908 [Digitaria exilis]
MAVSTNTKAPHNRMEMRVLLGSRLGSRKPQRQSKDPAAQVQEARLELLELLLTVGLGLVSVISIYTPPLLLHSQSLTEAQLQPKAQAQPRLFCSFLKRVATQDVKIGSETPAAGDGAGEAARKRPGSGDGPAPAPADKRRRPEPSSSSSGSRDRHGRRPSSAAEEKVRASHILIKHEGSRRKASWRDPEGVAISATIRDDAADLARALREQIVSGERKFEDVAAENSDCNSAKRGGDLGQCPRTANSSWPTRQRIRRYV